MSRLGTPRLHLRRTDSTNLRARALAGAGAPHGTLVTAAEQTAGRGRQGRTWTAPAGRALLASLVLRDPPALVSLRAGLAVAHACEAYDLQARSAAVKWPNDVLLDGAKVAGILVEGRPHAHWAVLGLGVNVAVRPADLPAELAGRAAGLGRSPDAVEPALACLLRALERALALPAEALLSQLRDRDALAGHPVRWMGGAGTAAGIDAAGRLRVDTSSGTIALSAGEVHLAS